MILVTVAEQTIGRKYTERNILLVKVFFVSNVDKISARMTCRGTSTTVHFRVTFRLFQKRASPSTSTKFPSPRNLARLNEVETSKVLMTNADSSGKMLNTNSKMITGAIKKYGTKVMRNRRF
jgi:hypothetical protein